MEKRGPCPSDTVYSQVESCNGQKCGGKLKVKSRPHVHFVSEICPQINCVLDSLVLRA